MKEAVESGLGEAGSSRDDLDKIGRRERILHAALELFLKKGFDGTPTSEIAAAAGTSKASVYHYFRTKQEILHALFYPSFDKVKALLEEAKDVQELFEGYLGIMLEERGLTTLLGADLSILSRPEIGSRAFGLMRGLRLGVGGEGASLAEKMRAECALGALRSAVISFPEADEETVREVALKAARAVLASE